ncbi:MAG: tRNA epoxyqueuosine(34) reductase QueG [Azoarcus sp.]|jgi:epoxyqueuosine reductase|nr:tRNA epoxyqueuosine(34) reductase QueG [Azoarcus sp.]
MSENDHPVDPVSDAATAASLAELAADIRRWAAELGFAALAIAPAETPPAAADALRRWLAAGHHGDMHYMTRHVAERLQPATLVPGAQRVICGRRNYLPAAAPAAAVLANPALAYVSRYALGRDYHKVLRARLQKLVERIAARTPARCRVFTDSAPVLEVALAQRAGLGWRGKHTLLLGRDTGSYFFLGEIFIDLPLPLDAPAADHCGTCAACLAACPTAAIVAPHELDARRCISYLTIEHPGAIPEPLRPQIGNRIYGCDDCQLVCPWNRFARQTEIKDFAVRQGLDRAPLTTLFAWSEAEFLARTAGSAIRRIGFERWSRNIAVALGNAPKTPQVVAALRARVDDASLLVREHVQWALARHGERG